MTSSSRPSNKSSSERQKQTRGLVQVKCSFCGNTFMAPLASAVCPKCGRPANKPLPIVWRAISFFIPPVGLGYGIKILRHSPVAARQCFLFSLLGLVLYAGLYLAFR